MPCFITPYNQKHHIAEDFIPLPQHIGLSAWTFYDFMKCPIKWPLEVVKLGQKNYKFFIFLPPFLPRCYPMLSNVIRSHPKTSKRIQKHSKGTPTILQSMSKVRQMKPMSRHCFCFKFVHIKDLKKKFRHRFHG